MFLNSATLVVHGINFKLRDRLIELTGSTGRRVCEI